MSPSLILQPKFAFLTQHMCFPFRGCTPDFFFFLPPQLSNVVVSIPIGVIVQRRLPFPCLLHLRLLLVTCCVVAIIFFFFLCVCRIELATKKYIIYVEIPVKDDVYRNLRLWAYCFDPSYPLGMQSLL